MMQLERYTKSLGESKQNQVSVLAPRVQVSATFSVTASVGGATPEDREQDWDMVRIKETALGFGCGEAWAWALFHPSGWLGQAWVG